LYLLLQESKPIKLVDADNATANPAGEKFQSDRSDRDTIVLLGKQTLEIDRRMVEIFSFSGGGVVCLEWYHEQEDSTDICFPVSTM
jgi:hypothetical protein